MWRSENSQIGWASSSTDGQYDPHPEIDKREE